MKEDAIFRIASQTKALVSVAAMRLQEEGKLLITDPVGKYIPEFQKTKVAVAARGRLRRRRRQAADHDPRPPDPHFRA